MALELNPDTTKKAVRLLQGAGRGVISEHGAQMAVQLLIDNGFQILEIMPDSPVEPDPVPPAPPVYGTMESIKLKKRRVIELRREIEDTEQEFIREMDEVMYNMHPIFAAIQMAMENKEVPKDGGEEG